MRVLFAAAEAAPFAKTGGLADVVGSLPKALKDDMDVRVVLPLYSDIKDEYRKQMKFKTSFDVSLAWRTQYCGIFELVYEGVTFYFLDNEYYFKRYGLYGYGDEPERFAFFSRAVLEALPHMGFQPDIIHCHDWHAAMISVFLRAHYGHLAFYQGIRTVFTIHNLAYQGVCGYSALHDMLGLSNDYFTVDGLEFYGSVNLLKGALNFSDLITTVSKTYAKEVQQPYFGHQLDGLLGKRSSDLYGVVNGIDFDVWNPTTDTKVFFPYDSSNLMKKTGNKLMLQETLGLPVRSETPVIGIVSRLVGQKGLDLIECVLEDILSMDVQLVVLGTGEDRYESLFRKVAQSHSDKVASNILFHDTLAHRIYAGSDIYLMPSLFEPCGLSQLIALRYGSLPIVRETGGLEDTVQSYNELTQEGNGFSFTNYNAHDMLYTIERAVRLYEDQETWAGIVKNAMSADNSWRRSATEYKELYRSLLSP